MNEARKEWADWRSSVERERLLADHASTRHINTYSPLEKYVHNIALKS